MVEKNRVKWVWKSNKWIVAALAYAIIPFSVITILNEMGIISDDYDNISLLIIYILACTTLGKTNWDGKNFFSKTLWVIKMLGLLFLVGFIIYYALGIIDVNPRYIDRIATWLASIPLFIYAMQQSTIFVKRKEAEEGLKSSKE